MEEKIDKAIEVVKRRMPALTLPADMQKAAQAVLNLKMAKVQYAGLSGVLDDELDEELTFVLSKVRSNLGANEMQQVTQAALHLMQAKVQNCPVRESVKATKTKTT